MLNHPTLDKLFTLKLTGMAKALSEQMDLPESQALSFEEGDFCISPLMPCAA
jgi:hypothetical protein